MEHQRSALPSAIPVLVVTDYENFRALCSSYLETAAQVARRNIYSVRSGWLDGVEWEKYVNELFMVTPEQVLVLGFCGN
eukprot:COSAG05_NODE_41_length_26845_cov_26.599230_9_plen_79_part_00